MSTKPKLEYYLLLAAQRSHDLIAQFIAIDEDKPVRFWEDLKQEQRDEHYERVVLYRDCPEFYKGDLMIYWRFRSESGEFAKDYLNRNYLSMMPKIVKIEEMLFRSVVIELIKVNQVTKRETTES